MKYVGLETFKDFKCIGADCSFTCCAGWNITIDKETAEYYNSVQGEFGERLNKSIEMNNDGSGSFVLTPDKRCPFLNEQNLCDIYTNLGEEHLCQTCTFYPRYAFVAGDIMFTGVRISCPVVAKFFLTHEGKLEIDYSEDKKKLRSGKAVNWNLFNNAVRAFTKSIEIAQNRTMSIRDRLAALVLFIYQLQAYIDLGRDPAGLIEAFSDYEKYSVLVKDTYVFRDDLQSKALFANEMLILWGRIAKIATYFPELYEMIEAYKKGDIEFEAEKILSAYEKMDESGSIWQEQVLVYGLFQYFMQGVEKKDFFTEFIIGTALIFLFSKVIIMLYYLMHDEMPDFEMLVRIITRISRVVEHDRKLCGIALDLLREKGMLELEFLLRLI